MIVKVVTGTPYKGGPSVTLVRYLLPHDSDESLHGEPGSQAFAVARSNGFWLRRMDDFLSPKNRENW